MAMGFLTSSDQAPLETLPPIQITILTGYMVPLGGPPIQITIQTGYMVPLGGVYRATNGHVQRLPVGTPAPGDLDGFPTRWTYIKP